MSKDKTLNEMHTALAKALLAKVKSGEATAAELSVARQMLKDNNITALTKPGTPLGSLTDEMGNYGDEDGDTPSLPFPTH